MHTFSDFMGADHNACDELFAKAEQAAHRGDWDTAEAANRAFLEAMERHLGMEEQVLFPAFEQASGSSMGPTQVMRHEHTQMRELFQEMSTAVAAKDADEFLGAGETLLILMQQHNAKEEQILYPMTDRILANDRDALLAKMEAFGSAA